MIEYYKNFNSYIEGEIWVPLPNYEGLYDVNNIGRVRSLPTVGRKNKIIILKQLINDNGYLIVNIYKNKSDRHLRVHIGVSEAFIPNLQRKKCVNHKNGIKTYNTVDNLEWVTHSENHKHAYATGLMRSAHIGKSGEKSYKHKVVEQYTKDGIKIGEYHSATVAHEKTGINSGHIGSVCNGKRKTTGGYIWKFLNK